MQEVQFRNARTTERMRTKGCILCTVYLKLLREPERHPCARILNERPSMNTRCLVSWIEFCLVFHDDLQEGAEGLPYTKK